MYRDIKWYKISDLLSGCFNLLLWFGGVIFVDTSHTARFCFSFYVFSCCFAWVWLLEGHDVPTCV